MNFNLFSAQDMNMQVPRKKILSFYLHEPLAVICLRINQLLHLLTGATLKKNRFAQSSHPPPPPPDVHK